MQRKAEAIVKNKAEAGNRIHNLYGSNYDGKGHADLVLYAGKNNE